MKTLGLCFLFLSFVLLAIVPVQAQSDRLGLNIDKDALQKWPPRKGQSQWPMIESNDVILPSDNADGYNPEANCVYMRTYRVKRDARDSDLTRPAGYTTCVPVSRFAVKRAVIPDDESDLGQNAPTR